jgi:hypothetical protein
LIAALLNQAGTTDTTVSSGTDPGQGKTPKALQYVAQRENSRDNWDRFMMEQALEELMEKQVNLISNKLDKKIEMRLFSKEIEEITRIYPDVIEMVEGAERGKVTITKKEVGDTQYDYQIVSGSTYKVDQERESQNINQILQFALQNYQILEPALNAKNKTIDLGELFQRSVISSGVQDWDKIIVDRTEANMANPANPPATQVQNPEQPMMGNQEQPQTGPGQFQDEDVRNFAQSLFGGVNG